MLRTGPVRNEPVAAQRATAVAFCIFPSRFLLCLECLWWVALPLCSCLVPPPPPCRPARRSDAIDQGRYFENGAQNGSNRTYLTGFTAFNLELRSFFLFDPTGLSSTLSAARLVIPNTSSLSFASPYSSPDLSETLALFDVSTPAGLLTSTSFAGTPEAVAGQQVFDDLGTGVRYGERSISPADSGSPFSIELNDAGLTALRTAISENQLFALGGALTSIDGLNLADPPTQQIFGFTGSGPVSLQVDVAPVPEPASLTLIGLGVAGLVGRTRLRRQQR